MFAIKKILYFSFRIIYTTGRWIRRRFTRSGLLVLGGLAASAVVGLDTNQTMAYQAFTFLVSLLMISLAWGMLFRGRFLAGRTVPRFGTVHEPIPYRITIRNLAGKTQKGLYISEHLESARPTFEEFMEAREPGEEERNPFDRAVGYHRWEWLNSWKRGAAVKEHVLLSLPPNGREEIRAEVVPLRRGHLRLSGLTIACPDPFGLFRSFVTVPAEQSVLVLPKRYSLPPVNLPGTRRYQPGGVALASSVGDSEEFISLRDYRPGDPLRRIHWKSWARTGRPIVKEFQDEFFVRHALIMDTFQKTDHSDIFEEAVSVAASFACTIQTQESLLDLMFVGTEAYCFTSGRGLAQTDRLLEILASVRACRDKPFSTLPPLVMERASLLSGCICILLSWDEDRQDFIGQLKRLGIPVLVLVITDSKERRPLDPGPMKDNPENFHTLEPGKIEEGLGSI